MELGNLLQVLAYTLRILVCASSCPGLQAMSLRQVIVGDESHVYVYEAGGMSVLGGVAFHVVPNTEDGLLPLDAVEQAIRQVQPHSL